MAMRVQSNILDKSMSSLNFSSDGHVNSPDRMNAKNARQNAAHNIVLLNMGAEVDHE